MNRIYQGRISKVEVLKSGTSARTAEYEPLSEDPKEAKAAGEKLLWEHHRLFQDAVNYYIAALAALGSSPESPLTKLKGLLGKVWEAADKKGQRRCGMRDSLQRAWQLPEPPTLVEAMERFRGPLWKCGVGEMEAELAGESLLFDLGGEGSIQQDGNEYWPYFCQSGFEKGVTFPREAAQREKQKATPQIPRLLWSARADGKISSLLSALKQSHFCNLSGKEYLEASEARALLSESVKQLQEEGCLPAGSNERLAEPVEAATPEIRRYAGGSINKGALKLRFHAYLVFKHLLPNADGLAMMRSVYDKPDKKKGAAKRAKLTDKVRMEERLNQLSDDPIRLVRDKARIVFRAFTALPVWSEKAEQESKKKGERTGPALNERSAYNDELEGGCIFPIAWKKFDIAAFKEALKVYNQFHQNVAKREEKLTGLATRLLVMDGERAMEGYTAATDAKVLCILQRVWAETEGKPVLPKGEGSEDQAAVRFAGDPRIEKLRSIVNDDLAEEYRLTEGRKTPYGLRRRTMKGWGDVKRKWQSKVKAGTGYSDAKRDELQAELDAMRGGEKREQIGSHRLFAALIQDEVGWSVWREPDEKFAQQILNKEWAGDPLEAYRQYCELRETLEEVSARPLNFTPADAIFSRRLFMFTDACSFGSDRGEYKHDLKALAVTVPVARQGSDGRYAVQNCRLTYSAPRLLRDRIRAEDGGYVQDWSQPMMRALFGAAEEKMNPQDLKDAAVQLMPDWDKEGEWRMLLNFPLSLDESVSIGKIGKAARWEKQFVTWKKGKQIPFLRWAGDFDGKETHRWWEKGQAFQVLAADLGTRRAASMALVECSRTKTPTARSIGKSGDVEWFARFQSGRILRLPGEDAEVLRKESKLEADGEGLTFRQECYGDRGRMADSEECAETLEVLEALKESKMLADVEDAAALQKRLSFPEQNDKLLVAVRRAQKWIADCISWHWKLTQPDSPEQRTAALAVLREQEREKDWNALADGAEANTAALRQAIHSHIIAQRRLVQANLLKLTWRILPLRGRDWTFVANPEWENCWQLQQTPRGSAPKNRKLLGQRGLSMARIEQVSELRRRWQSLNQALRREIGSKPPTAAEMRNDPIPDPCPDLLRKMENLREQRVNQTAHLIIAQALGLKLTPPQSSRESRAKTDTHGEYAVARPSVDFIVLEDLSRYLSDQGRARSENSRLMKWCHRQITEKLKMLAEPFGIPVLETPAAYSSRFCSLTGMAGFRAAEVSWQDRHEFRWRVLLAEAAAAKENGETRDANVARAVKLFEELEKISSSPHPQRTLLAPQPGGPMFVTARAVPHPAPAKSKQSGTRPRMGGNTVLPQQADLNAAINLALRAVAHPSCAGIHHRLRTERKKAVRGGTDSFTVKEARRFGKEKPAVEVKPDDYLPKERNPNLFYDPFGVAEFGRARIAGDAGEDYHYASGPGVWMSANDREKQWVRCFAINAQRMSAWDEDQLP